MINFSDITELIAKCKTPYVRICDLHGNKILVIENTTVNATIKELENFESMLKAYGKLEVYGATIEQYKSNYKGAYKWILSFDSKKDSQQSTQITGNNWGQSPVGFVSVDVMNAKLNEIQKEHEWNKKFAELEKKFEKPEDDFKKYIGYAPLIMGILGIADDKIEKVVKFNNLNTVPSMAYVPPTNTLTFKDIEPMTSDEKNQKIQTLLDSVASKISAEHMIMMLESIDMSPVLCEQTIILATKVSSPNLKKLVDAIDKDPSIVEKAITFL